MNNIILDNPTLCISESKPFREISNHFKNVCSHFPNDYFMISEYENLLVIFVQHKYNEYADIRENIFIHIQGTENKYFISCTNERGRITSIREYNRDSIAVNAFNELVEKSKKNYLNNPGTLPQHSSAVITKNMDLLIQAIAFAIVFLLVIAAMRTYL